ncbi:TnpV protein [Ruthenibacterium lactatiformans]|uniref:TnpV protein n=1 Tax=Ruthenibacterium lactatiformans TaxID=1550024 RepID=UPI003132C29E
MSIQLGFFRTSRGGANTEQLKADDMMAWVQAMNNISNQAREIVITEVIYTV